MASFDGLVCAEQLGYLTAIIPALFVMEMVFHFLKDPLWFAFTFEWLPLLGFSGLEWRCLGDIHSRSPGVCSSPRRVLETPVHEAALSRLLVLFGEGIFVPEDLSNSIIMVITAPMRQYCASIRLVVLRGFLAVLHIHIQENRDLDICRKDQPHHAPASMLCFLLIDCHCLYTLLR